MYAAPAPIPRESHGREGVPVASPVGRVDILDAEANDEEHDGNLDDHDSGIETRTLLDTDHQNRRNDQSDHERRKVEADLDSKNFGRVDHIVRALNQFRRVGPHDGVNFFEERLRARNEARIEACAIWRATIFSAVRKPGPVVVRQPQRHLDVENIEQLDEVVRPAGRDRARAHGVFQRQVPADNPGEQFAQSGVSIGISAARERNHRGKFGVAEPGEGAADPGKHEGEHQARPA